MSCRRLARTGVRGHCPRNGSRTGPPRHGPWRCLARPSRDHLPGRCALRNKADSTRGDRHHPNRMNLTSALAATGGYRVGPFCSALWRPRDGSVRWRLDTVAVVTPSRRRTTFLAMSSARGSSRRTKLALAARMMPFSSKVSASGSSSAGSSCLLERGDDELADQRGEAALERGDLFLDRSRTGAHLQDGAGEEAAARERAPHEMVEERVADRDELRESRRRGERRFDDLGLEDPPGFVDGGELELLLRAEVGVDAALAHVEPRGEVADREAFEAVDRGERHRLAHDRLAGALAVGTLLPWIRAC